jgi:UDP-N-acetyl-D-glucosamine dehydrogenase
MGDTGLESTVPRAGSGIAEGRLRRAAGDADEGRAWDVAVIGAGYVGLPLARAFAEAGRTVVLVDVVGSVVDSINRGESHIDDVPSDTLKALVDAGALSATTDYGAVREADAILIAVPTPLSPQREPDLSFIEDAAASIAPNVRAGHLVVLESTTYPGTTREVLQPLLEQGSGLRAGADFHLAFSPERVDPGNRDYTTRTTPKIVGGIDEASTEAAAALYRRAVDEVHTVSTPEAAELTKLLENIFRSVNIALVNELAQLCDRMDIDVWEVVDAAATKPFGFMSFKPGPGLGGHCIPIDPFYLTWKAREFDFSTRFVELAGEVNNNMPYFCRSVVSQALNHGAQKSLKGSRILVLGVAYKADIGDVRESPAEKLIELLRNAGADVAYHDPHVPAFDGMRSAALEPEGYDCVVIVTAHSSIDYEDVVRRGSVIVDFRNATRARDGDGKVWKL